MQILSDTIVPHSSGQFSYRIQRRATTTPSPVYDTASVAGFIVTPRQELALTQHPTRGWTIPGGHLEKRETPRQAFIRESMEEVGMSVTKVKTFGYISMEVLGPKPEGYSYPYPTRYCQLYIAWLDQPLPFTPTSDSLDRQLLRLDHPDTLHYLKEDRVFLPLLLKLFA